MRKKCGHTEYKQEEFFSKVVGEVGARSIKILERVYKNMKYLDL